MKKQVKKPVLIANRGEIACRIMATCNKLGIPPVTVYTNHDESSLHCRNSSSSHLISSYTDPEELIRVAKLTNAGAIHPGYGFLSENAEFASLCARNSITFIGPSPETIRLFGSKHNAKQLALNAGIPVVPGSNMLSSVQEAAESATDIGYPVLLKAVAGGGGIGIYECYNEQDIISEFDKISALVKKQFGDGSLMIEKYLPNCRHIEVQIFGDGKGNVAVFGERECSTQRRYQKVIEEAPAPNLENDTKNLLFQAARRICSMGKYESVGTIEFLVNAENTTEFYFIEANTRIQVEHQVTELIYGDLDIVELMIQQCSPDKPNLDEIERKYQASGHAIQVRLYTEDARKGFTASIGVFQEFSFPIQQHGFHLAASVQRGSEVSLMYDPMISKVLQWGPTRKEAINLLHKSLANANVYGPVNNLEFITSFITTDVFLRGEITSKTLENFHYVPEAFEVLRSGFMTSVQCYPGRDDKGLWRVGVPPSAAADSFSCRLANRLVGNSIDEAVLECTIKGPTLKFLKDAVISLTGAQASFVVNNEAKPMWTTIQVPKGAIVSIGKIYGPGCRMYLSIQGGIDVPKYLNSKSTFTNASYGGYQGRSLQPGDLIRIGRKNSNYIPLKLNKLPEFTVNWNISVLPGPYADPDYFTSADINMLYSTKWRVHHESNRLGIRLIGPSPTFARPDGGEGGSHPSNVHDYVYAIGSVNFTGSMPIIIGTDGPSLGGFVCPCTIIEADLWKVGQLCPGDSVQFVQTTINEAVQLRMEQEDAIGNLFNKTKQLMNQKTTLATQAVLKRIPKSEQHPGIQIRLSGDRYILIEYGPMELDLNLRFRVHFLEKTLLESRVDGIEETAPGVRSLQVRFNPLALPFDKLLDIVCQIDDSLPDITQLVIPTRVINLPMCFNYSGVDRAIKKYMKQVRPVAPYLPSNIEFIKMNNGLSTCDDVKEKVFSASYMCLGLGDVYLGAPCAVPINPLHRVVVPKYNPARTFTQEGTVGLGGSYMCIYPMNSPGGYQLIGRTLSIWNTYANGSPLFSESKPWLLEMFDQIRFFEVSEQELDEMRHNFSLGKLDIKVHQEDFIIQNYNKFLQSINPDVESYKCKQKKASLLMNEEEKKSLATMRLQENGINNVDYKISDADETVNDDEEGIYADVPGIISQLMVLEGETVKENQVLVVLSAMKMNNTVCCLKPGIIRKIFVNEKQMIQNGSLLMIIKTIG